MEKRENFSLLITFSIEFIDTIRFIKAFEIRFMATKYPFHLVPNISINMLAMENYINSNLYRSKSFHIM